MHKRLGGHVVLGGVDLRMADGESVALLGPNGAGKTTLLRTIVDLVRPDSGDVRVAGALVARDRAAVARVGWALGDEHAWYWRLSGRTNLRLFGRLRGLSRSAAASAAEPLLDELGLSGAVADRAVAEYSTGMRSRLALARARLGDPRLIILDEVARGLDAGGQAQFQDWLRSAARPAVLVVTHALDQTAGVVDRVVLMQRGRITAELAGAEASHADLTARVRELTA